MSEQYIANGPGAALLAHDRLKFLKTTDPFLGSIDDTVPDGPFNRELWKLHQNDAALADSIYGYLNRTFGALAENAHAVDAVPVPLTGAPVTPTDKAFHTVYYLDYEVFYRYDANEGVWEEMGRAARVVSVVTKHTATVTVVPGDGIADVNVELPTEDDNQVAWAFTLADLKTFYVVNLDAEAPFVSVLPGLVNNDPTLRLVLSSAPVEGADYQVVLHFEHIEQTV